MKTLSKAMLLLAILQPGSGALAEVGSAAPAATASAIFAGGCF